MSDKGAVLPQPPMDQALAMVTVRDYFAAKALPANMRIGYKENWSAKNLAEECYIIADAMLVERAK